MVASLLTCSGASVGVSISTQRRMPSRMVVVSKGFAVVSMPLLVARWIRVNATLARFHPRRNRSDGNSALVGPFARGDLFHQFDNAAPELGVLDARERAGQRQTFGSREEIRNVGRRRPFAEAVGAGGAAGTSLEQKRHRDLKYFGDLL